MTLDDALVVTDGRAAIRGARRCTAGAGGVDSRKSQVVEMRFFGGLSVEETAEALHVSEDTVMRDWRLARCGSCANCAGRIT